MTAKDSYLLLISMTGSSRASISSLGRPAFCWFSSGIFALSSLDLLDSLGDGWASGCLMVGGSTNPEPGRSL